MTDLATRIEGLDGPDGTVDRLIGRAVGWKHIPSGKFSWMKPNGMYSTTGLPRFTASLDAAMMLVPEGWLPVIDCTYIRPEVELHPTDEGSFGQGRRFGKAAAPALALCAAALRAREQSQ